MLMLVSGSLKKKARMRCQSYGLAELGIMELPATTKPSTCADPCNGKDGWHQVEGAQVC